MKGVIHLASNIRKYKREFRGRLVSPVRKRSKQTLSIEELIVQPWFLPKPVAKQFRRLVPADFRQRMQNCFIDFGCLRCERRDRVYGANGMCVECKQLVCSRVVASGNKRIAN